MINEKAEGFRAVVRDCKDRLRRAWELNLRPSEMGVLQKQLHEAVLGLRRMGLKEERKPGTLMKPRKPHKKDGIPEPVEANSTANEASES